MDIKVKARVVALLGAGLLVTSTMALASKPAGITERDMALLPRFCPDTMGFNYGDASSNTSPNARMWVEMMGRDFWHVHHYCWALINIHRSERAAVPAELKQAQREEAFGDLNYVVQNTQPNFILLPEIFTWMGRLSILLRNDSAAGQAFAKARALKPDYWPAYTNWAEALAARGAKAEALAIVRSGLQYAPNARSLRDLYARLGGKPADIPPPIVKKEPETEAAEQAPAAELAPSTPVTAPAAPAASDPAAPAPTTK